MKNTEKRFNQIIDLKLTIKFLQRQALKSSKDEKSFKLKVKKASSKETSTEHESTPKQRSANGASTRTTSSAWRPQSKTQSISNSMSSIVRSLESSLNTGNLGRMSETMDRFERQFVDMEVQGEFVERSMAGSTALPKPEDKVEELMDQVREEYGLEVGVGLPRAGRNKVVVGVREEVSLSERVPALRARG